MSSCQIYKCRVCEARIIGTSPAVRWIPTHPISKMLEAWHVCSEERQRKVPVVELLLADSEKAGRNGGEPRRGVVGKCDIIGFME